MKTIRKYMTILLAAMMLAVLLPIAAQTALAVDWGSGVTVTLPVGATQSNLQSAINSASNGVPTTIKLQNNIVTSSTVTIPANKVIRLVSSDLSVHEPEEYENVSEKGGGAIVLTKYKIDAHRSGNGGIMHFSVITVEAGATLCLEQIIVRGAYKNGSGGGVYNQGTLVLEKGARISDNTISNVGGGVYNGGTFTMNAGAEILDNSAPGGGGVYNGSIFTMTGGKISGNEASHFWAEGGGVCNDGTFTMTGGTIAGNDSYWMGGGVYNSGANTFTMTGGSILSNTADLGGGVCGENHSPFSSPGLIALTNGTIADNKAASGGGIYTDSGHIALTNCIVSGNTATYAFGGGIYIAGNGDYETLITNSAISGNKAAKDGGGIYTEFRYSLFVSSTAFTNNAAKYFVAVAPLPGDQNIHTENIIGCTFTDNPMTGSPFAWAYNNYDVNYAPQPAQYSVTYAPGTTDPVTNMPTNGSGTAGQPFNIASGKPQRAGYTFKGWQFGASSITYPAGGSFTMPYSNVVLTAKWAKGYVYQRAERSL